MKPENFFNAVTIINGNISNPFEVQRGCRQGDPIAVYLFILAIEILAQILKNSKNLIGLRVDCVIYLIFMLITLQYIYKNKAKIKRNFLKI